MPENEYKIIKPFARGAKVVDRGITIEVTASNGKGKTVSLPAEITEYYGERSSDGKFMRPVFAVKHNGTKVGLSPEIF